MEKYTYRALVVERMVQVLWVLQTLMIYTKMKKYTDFGILREIVDKNTVRYRCKSPQKSNFDALVFCIHFNKKSF